MRIVAIASACLLAPMVVGGAARAESAADAAEGVWLRGDGNARVRFAPCGSDMCATNVWIKDTSKGEHVGDKLVLKVKPESDHVLVGTAYDPKRRMDFSFTMTVENASLTTKGCAVVGLICKTESWTRVK